MVSVMIMSGYGINSEKESAHAFEKAGARCEIVHVNDLIDGLKKMEDYDIIMFPGGFSYGDDTGSGRAFANKIKNNLWQELLSFIRSGKLILGVCNGFQIMAQLGLFAAKPEEYGKITHALEANNSNRFECRPAYIKTEKTKGVLTKCVFTNGINTMQMPVSHGEGRFFCEQKELDELKRNGQVVFRYCDAQGKEANGKYPFNPNGALYDIAGICDGTGRLMGMMPHPERMLYTTSDPLFHLKKEEAMRKGERLPELVKENFMLFRNAVEFAEKRGKICAELQE
jgi:phosphoribosylformylglycinamidine synthase